MKLTIILLCICLTFVPVMAVDDQIRSLVDNIISSKAVAVFSKSDCPFSDKAKTALSHYPINPDKMEILELDHRHDGDQILEYLGELTGASTVPRVFIGGNFVGGGDDMKRMHDDEELEDLLEDAGAL